MLEEYAVPPVDPGETVARYLLNKRNIRADKTIKPDEFIPFKYVDLSVNRHRECTETEIWQFGRQVAEQREKELLGRTDIKVEDCTIDTLSVVAAPIPGNSNQPISLAIRPKKQIRKL